MVKKLRVKKFRVKKFRVKKISCSKNFVLKKFRVKKIRVKKFVYPKNTTWGIFDKFSFFKKKSMLHQLGKILYFDWTTKFCPNLQLKINWQAFLNNVRCVQFLNIIFAIISKFEIKKAHKNGHLRTNFYLWSWANDREK